MAPIVCVVCAGSGMVSGGYCWQCSGKGYITDLAKIESAHFEEIDVEVEQVLGALNDVLDKCNDIIAEQASQREALTAALTQIWNKVKDL